MKYLLLFIIIMIFIFNIKENFTKPIFSRPNKCFSCEQHATSWGNAHLAFPTKCISCEKEPITIPYYEGTTKCFSCSN